MMRILKSIVTFLAILLIVLIIVILGDGLLPQLAGPSGGPQFPWNARTWEGIKDGALISSTLMGDIGYYAPLIKNFPALGFKPDERSYDCVLSIVRKYYVKSPDEGILIASCEKELSALFRDAHVVAEPSLKDCQLDKRLIPTLVQRYGRIVNAHLMVLAIMRGAVRGLNDPYSYLLTPREASSYFDYLELKRKKRDDGTWHLAGVGLHLEPDKKDYRRIIVMGIDKNSPASKESIFPGDVLESINGRSARNIPVEAAATQIKGKAGTLVSLKVSSGRDKKVHELHLRRSSTLAPMVDRAIVEGGFGYIRIGRVAGSLKPELFKTMEDLHGKQVKWLILDLRNSDLVYLDHRMVENISSLLALHCVLPLAEENKKTTRNPPQEYPPMEFSTVVLVNRYTARFCEALAADLQDRKAALLIGERTYGIGSRQDVFNFKEKYALKLTVAYFRSSAGRLIIHRGIDPDVTVPMDPVLYATSIDTQIQEAKSRLKGGATPEK